VIEQLPGPEAIDQFRPEPAGKGSLRETPVAVPVPAALLLEAVTVNPTADPADTVALSAVLLRVRLGQSTVVLAFALRPGELVDVSVAVFASNPQLANVVALVTCTDSETPEARSTAVQVRT
jgi:hypothetical protein